MAFLAFCVSDPDAVPRPGPVTLTERPRRADFLL